jgi:Mor family transcriptional regulator
MKSTRNAEICAAYRAGKSLRKIAAMYALSHERVRNILQERRVKLRPRGVHTRHDRAQPSLT